MFAALSFFSACNDEWKDELYSHMISLKAPIGSEEVSDIYVRYKPNGEVVYDLPVLVSGSTPLDRDLNVRIAVDPDTLVALNLANYHELRKDLWYDYYLSKTMNLQHLPAICLQAQERNYSLSNLSFLD